MTHTKALHRHRQPLASSLARLLGLLLPAVLATPALAQGGGVFRPAPVVFITYDNSASMDFTAEAGFVPSFPAVCDPAVEYARTRHVIGIEALTGTLENYCPIEVDRSLTPGTRDDADTAIPHTQPQFDWQHRNGLLDVYSDEIYFGLGTFDALPSPFNTEAGDYSYGPDYGPVGSELNLGLASPRAPLGGLVSPLPPGWLPPRPGAVTTFRTFNNGRVQDTILNVIPGGATPIAAALDDVQVMRHLDPGLRSDAFWDCRDVAHVLVTDGVPFWDKCIDGTGDGWMGCTDYLNAGFTTAAAQAAVLADGTACPGCPAAVTEYRPVPTFVVGMFTEVPDDPSLMSDALEIATAGDTDPTNSATCALVDGSGNCQQYAYYAGSQAELNFALGTVFNRFMAGTLSMVPPLTSTVAFDSATEGDIGLVRFRAGTVVSPNTPFRTGTLTRQFFTCLEPAEGEPEELLLASTNELHTKYTSAIVDTRTVYTGRLDIASEGASCERPDCPIDDPTCYASGAVPDPQSDGTLVDFGDGTGGLTAGGAALDEDDAQPPLPTASCTNLASTDIDPDGIDNDGDGMRQANYDACEADCNGDADCICRCEETYACGTCGYDAVVPSCDSLLMDTCRATCPVLGILIEKCDCYCEALYGCGACWDGAPDDPVVDSDSREAVINALMAERSLASVAGNDAELPAAPGSVDFTTLESVEGSCLIPLDQTTFTGGQDLSGFLYADQLEAQQIIEFTRGATLQSLRDDFGIDLLGELFDSATVELYDRPADGYVGGFMHTRMALQGRPSRINRTSPGYLRFIEQHGDRPYTLFAGANDGMLHAYDAETGAEMWAIVPPSFLPTLAENMTGYRPSVDGAVTLRDVVCGTETVDGETFETWCSLAAVSYRRGGSGAMVLDVSDPTSPRFLFEVTGRQIPELGLGYPAPLLGNMFVNGAMRPVLVLSGGRPLRGPEMTLGTAFRGSSEGETIVILDAVTGEIYRQFDPVSHPGIFRQCGPVTGSPAAWSPEIYTRLMAGTQNGCLLRVDTSSDTPADWSLNVLYQLDSRGEVTQPPAIATNARGRLVIVYGTGNTDEYEHVAQVGNIASVLEELEKVEFDEGIEGDDTDDVLEHLELPIYACTSPTDNDCAPANWEIVLEPGEILTTAPIVSDGIVFVGSWVPGMVLDDAGDVISGTVCQGGSSRLYTIDFLGEPSVDGPDATRPELVSITSDRIMGRFPNPDFDENDPTSEEVLKYLDATHLGGDNTVILGVSITPVPNCEQLSPLVSQTEGIPVMATTRQLVVDVIGESTSSSADAAETSEPPPPVEPEIGLITIEHTIPQPSMSALPLDWGVVLEF